MAWSDDVVTYRRALHRIPELAFQEEATRDYLEEHLTGLGLAPRRAGGTGLVVDIAGQRPGPCLAIRADMDGLPLTEETGLNFASEHPGIMHACGHDGHMAIVLALADRLVAEPMFSGTVRLIFQPAEERPPGGAQRLIAEGALDGVDEIYGLHLWADFPVGVAGIKEGAMMANADQFTVRIQGKGGHGSQPEATQDAVLIAAQTVVNLQTVVSRRVPPLEPAVVSCGTIHGGQTFNIIAETAEITGTVRTLSMDTQRLIEEEIRRIAQGTAALYGAQAELIYDKGYPAVLNHERAVAIWKERLRGLVEVIRPQPSMGGEDFAYYLQQRPGAFLFLGAKPGHGTAFPHHSPHFVIDERALPLGVEVFYRLICA
ncbi:MAG: amidohydrolase [Firmicutes bacterium]|nr:amidohydrolase [Bacillota bacterium]